MHGKIKNEIDLFVLNYHVFLCNFSVSTFYFCSVFENVFKNGCKPKISVKLKGPDYKKSTCFHCDACFNCVQGRILMH